MTVSLARGLESAAMGEGAWRLETVAKQASE